MLQTKMISAMKHVKDRMNNPMPVAEMNQLLDVFKSAGASHVEIASVIGHPNFASYSKQWADAIHARGMAVTWRCAHQNMEGIYNAPKYVGANRKPEQFWIDEAVNAFNSIKEVIHTDDEEAIYPERTEGYFSDATAFLTPNTNAVYANFFVKLHTALKVFPWIVGLSANNASELFSGWMPKVLSDTYGIAVVDHYKDGDPTGWEADVRSIKTKYGKPVYVQEGAPDRFNKPTYEQAKTYFNACKRLDSDGVLVGFGSWSGWAGTPESIVDKVNGVYVLNDSGKALKEWWTGSVTPPPPPPPVPQDTMEFAHRTGSKGYGLRINGKYIEANSEESMRPMLTLLFWVKGIYCFTPDGKIDFTKAKDI